MTTSSKALAGLFADLGKHGFRKRGLVWCRRSTETLFSFELQKSKHGDLYFINLGVLFLCLESGDDRPPHKCHFYGRYGDEVTVSRLNFDDGPFQDRDRVLAQFRDEQLVPVAIQCSTETGAASFFASGTLRVPFVLPDARGVLGLPDRSPPG